MQILRLSVEYATLVAVALLGLVACVNSQNDTAPSLTLRPPLSTSTSTFTSTSTSTEATIPVVKCGSTQTMVDECFKDLPPHLMEFLQTTKIAINERDIVAKCTVFNRGMRCFDDYTSRCLADKKLSLFKNNVEGARKFFLRFCSDREFQKDYLQHKDCFTYIQDDWVLCTKNFQNIVTEELHGDRTNITNKFMEFCCARYAYENCIYNSARYKCYKNSAKFARDTAKMLSDEKHFSNCRQYERTLCSAGHVHRLTRRLLLLLLSLLPAVRMMMASGRRRQP